MKDTTATEPEVAALAGNPPESKSRAYYMLGLLTAIYAVAHIDRQILGVLIQPIKEEFGLSDTVMGSLSGAFAISYIIVSLPLAALADRRSRCTLLAGCVAVWSLMTMACGMVQSYWQLMFARLTVGASESGAHPIALSMLSDVFPPDKRSGAFGVYGMSTSLGTLFSLLVGGMVASAFGWRAAFMVVGIPGLLLALLMFFTVKEPVRGASENRSVSKAPPIWTTVKFMMSRPSLRYLILALVFFVMAYVALLTWLPAFFLRSHNVDLGYIGPALGLTVGLGGALGALAGGYICDALRRRSERAAPIYLGLTYLACAPFACLGLMASDVNVGLVWLAGWALASGLGTGPQNALLQGLVGIRMRAVSTAIIGGTLNLGGLFIGPQITGILSDAYAGFAGEESLRFALVSMLILYVAASGLCLLVARNIVDDTRIAEKH